MLRCPTCAHLAVTPRTLRAHVEGFHPDELRSMGPRGYSYRIENTNSAGAFGFIDRAVVDFHMGRHGREAREAAEHIAKGPV